MDNYSCELDFGKQGAPRKSCSVCGGTILWRRRLAVDWDKVVYCSASCRRISVAKLRDQRDTDARSGCES